MNAETILTGVGSGGAIGVIYVLWKVFKHSRCRSSCCGKEASMSVDLEKGFGDTKRDIKPTIEKT